MLRLRSTTASSALAAAAVATTTPLLAEQRHLFASSTNIALGRSQLSDMPASTTRKPSGPHRGPGKRMVSEQEQDWWQYVKKWEHQMSAEWDDLEAFQHLPKPKKLFGNEACEIVWPYSVLLENVIKIHPFTKSLYVYYPKNTLTDEGEKAALLARRFARECLVPICFHNSQCYVETEMLLEHSDTAWVVVHCLDGRHEIVRVDPSGTSSSSDRSSNNGNSTTTTTQDEQKLRLLQQVLETASGLGTTVEDPASLTLQLNERPIQNAFIRVDYQWMGDTPEERQSHLVRWVDPDERGVQPMMYNRDHSLADWLNTDGDRALSPGMFNVAKRDNKRMMKGKGRATLSGYFNGYTRLTSTYSKNTGTTGRQL